MKFTINKNLFLEKINVAQKAMASRSNMPALTGILFSCKEDKLVMTTSNGEVAIRVTISDPSLNIEKTGVCLIPGKIFGDIIRKLNGDEIEIELEDDNILRIQCGASDITLNLLDVEDYPEPNFATDSDPIKIKSSLLKEIVKQTTFASSTIDSKPILTGVNLRVKNNEILAVATDSFRLSKRSAKLDEDYLETNIIIPSRNFNEIAKAIESDNTLVELYLVSNKIIVKFDDVMFQARLLDGTYPETSRLIPTNFMVTLKFDKSELISAIDRVATLSANQNSTTVVKMSIDELGRATLTSSSPELGSMKDFIVPEEATVGSPLTISFSATYFLDALRAFYSEKVSVKFNGEIKPFIFEADNDEGLVELVLPMKTD